MPKPQLARDTEPALAGGDPRAGGVSVWAVVGALWLLFIGQALIRWVSSSWAFHPAPILGPDHFSNGLLITLRVIEGFSVVILVLTVWGFLIKPWRREGRIQLDGMIVIGALFASAIDPVINYFHYTFAWNAHAFNEGTWLNFFPNSQGPNRYGEGFVWFVPQYLYLGIGLASIESWLIMRQRERNPNASNVRTFALATLAIFVLDIFIEQLFIRTKVYAFPRGWKLLTLWPGREYQFPINESLSVAAYSLGFTWLRMSARDSPDGLSVIERGIHRIRPRLRTGVRLLAVTGFCAVWAAVAYFIPWSWLSVSANAVNHHVPSYMLPGPQHPR
jgi:multisubunit Na+/H+ antiporter MnhB subunit